MTEESSSQEDYDIIAGDAIDESHKVSSPDTPDVKTGEGTTDTGEKKEDKEEEGEEEGGKEKKEGEEEDTEDKEGEEEEDEEDKDDKKDEEDEEDEEDKKKDVKEVPGTRPTTKAILSKYPEFFKDFPDLRHAFFREQEFTKIFPTVADASDAKEQAENLESITDMVIQGDVKGFLDTIGDSDKGVVKTFSDNFLSALYTTDSKLYYNITSPLLENFLHELYNHGVKSKDENIQNSALQAALWAFGDSDIAKGKKVLGDKSTDSVGKTDLEKEKDEFYTERYTTFRSDVTTTASKRLRSSVLKGFDPNGVFGDDLKVILLDRICSEVDTILEGDKSHMSRMVTVWKKAARAGYTADWKSRVYTAYLERARAVMPAIRQRIVKAAVSSKKKVSDDMVAKGKEGSDHKDIVGSTSTKSGRSETPRAKDIDWDNTSDLDYLEGNIKTRKRA